LALFVDFENIAIGVRDAHYRKFDVNLVLERLLDKGKLLVKKAYADWSRYSDYKRSFHEAAIELIEVPQKSVGGKNSADIRLVVDAMDMSFQKEHINCFVIASGDSDFSPLVSKLKENNKYVIGLGVKNSTSDLLLENCDEFIFYEDLVRGQQRPMPQIGNVPEKVAEVFSLLVDSVLALQRENKEILWGSMVKETMKRKKPSFNETYYGFRTFSHLLEDAQRRGIVELRRDQKSGSYVIEDLGSAGIGTARPDQAGPVGVPSPAPAASRPVETSRPAEPQEPEIAAGPVAVEGAAAEGTNGAARAPRRRRSRARRPRTGSALAAGAFPDSGGAGAEGASGAEDDAEVADHADPAESDHAEAPDTDHDHARSAAPVEKPAETAPAAARDEDTGPFSFFSWMRREPDKKKRPGGYGAGSATGIRTPV
jgi:uncharacterized LabA/DUF88 family protein